MLIYLDNCALQRPFDDRSQQRIRVEAEATLALVDLVERGELDLLSSDALIYEIAKAPDPVRRDFALAVLEHATAFIEASQEVVTRAEAFVGSGAHPLDALHLASAIQGGARYFSTSDERLLRVARRLELGGTEAVSLLHLIEEVSHGSDG
jgi:predicted nucleic acid-binding protein